MNVDKFLDILLEVNECFASIKELYGVEVSQKPYNKSEEFTTEVQKSSSYSYVETKFNKSNKSKTTVLLGDTHKVFELVVRGDIVTSFHIDLPTYAEMKSVSISGIDKAADDV